MGGRHADILTGDGTDAESTDPGPEHTLPGRIPAESYQAHGGDDTGQRRYERDGITLRRHGDDSVHVAWLKSGQWLAYDAAVAEAGAFELTVRLAAAPEYGGGSLAVHCDGTRVGQLQFAPTGGWYDWACRSARVGLAAGDHRIRLTAEEGGWSLDWLALQRPE